MIPALIGFTWVMLGCFCLKYFEEEHGEATGWQTAACVLVGPVACLLVVGTVLLACFEVGMKRLFRRSSKPGRGVDA